MLWTDTHFHSGEYLPDFERYTQEAGQAGVGILLLCASGAAEVPLAKAAAERFPGIYYAAGIHPHNAESDQDFLPCLESFAEDPKLAAAGEIGLDYFYDFCPRSVQLKVLEENGLVKRVQYETIPPKVEYSLTEIGHKFHPVVAAMEAWGNEYIQYLAKKEEP